MFPYYSSQDSASSLRLHQSCHFSLSLSQCKNYLPTTSEGFPLQHPKCFNSWLPKSRDNHVLNGQICGTIGSSCPRSNYLVISPSYHQVLNINMKTSSLNPNLVSVNMETSLLTNPVHVSFYFIF